jgi:hypothetical protein
MPTLRSVPGRTLGVAVDGAAAGCPAWPCRRVRTTLPPSQVSAVPADCGLPVSTSRVRGHASGPSMSAGCADLARNPSRCPRNRTPRPCPRCVRDCGQMLAGRPLSAVDTAAAPLSRAGTWRSQAADRPCTPRRLRRWTQAAACSIDGGGSTEVPPLSTLLANSGCW